MADDLVARSRSQPEAVQAAFGYYQQAAMVGHPPAMTRAAMCYLRGEGVAADEQLARSWL